MRSIGLQAIPNDRSRPLSCGSNEYRKKFAGQVIDG